MADIKKFVRQNILSLKPYTSARDEFKGENAILLDANENPHGTYNRYPDPYQIKLKQKLSEIKDIPIDRIFIGNGSDEIIDLTYRIFCEPKIDRVVICPPTYGMYSVLAQINDVEIVEVPLLDNFELDIDKIMGAEAKVLFLCFPNNPTGNTFKDLKLLIQHFKGIVFIDEAYIDFCSQKSFLKYLDKYNNLIISQTLSKAWGAAGLRIGFAFAQPEIIELFNKVKYPYNISAITQKAALEILDNVEDFKKNIDSILEQKKWLINELKKIDIIEKVYSSEANFILVKTKNANKIYEMLKNKNIVVRNRNSLIAETLRITIGTPEENQKLIEAFKQIKL